jgi:hypothetical protein
MNIQQYDCILLVKYIIWLLYDSHNTGHKISTLLSSMDRGGGGLVWTRTARMGTVRLDRDENIARRISQAKPYPAGCGAAAMRQPCSSRRGSQGKYLRCNSQDTEDDNYQEQPIICPMCNDGRSCILQL